MKTKDLSEMKCLKILYTNADVLTNKMDELQVLVKQDNCEVIAITEVLPKHSFFPIQEQELVIEGFSNISNFDIAYKEGGRGIVLFIKNNLSFKVKDLPVKFQEFLIIEVCLSTGQKLLLGVIYRSPNSSIENNMLLLKAIEALSSEPYANLLIMGDFNLPKIDWCNLKAPISSFEDTFVEVVMDNFLFQHVP